MIFIMPWRSQIHQNVFLKKNINGYFDALLEPKSKIDLKYEQELMLKQSKQPE